MLFCLLEGSHRSENTQGLGSHPFDERFFKELFLNLSKRSGLGKSITKERKHVHEFTVVQA